MENGLIESPQNEIMGVSSKDVAAISAHLKVIKNFISGEMKEGIDNDFGIIPGTKKKVLLKPGAEKLMKLFHFASKVDCVEKTVSPDENFAMFTYKAQVIHLKSGNVVAECEGTANSMESKYKKSEAMNILNTLMKMAQKRAIVGAVILATGASDYFTQDEEEIRYQNTPKNVDNSKFIDVNAQPTSSLSGYVVSVGKHQGKTFGEIGPEALSNYLNWITDNVAEPKGKMLEVLNAGREFLREAI